MMEERMELSIQRIREIESECEIANEYADYFIHAARHILNVYEVYQNKEKKTKLTTLPEKQKQNETLYYELLPKHYETSYANPAYAVLKLGKEYGVLLCAVYAELFSMISYAFEQDSEQFVIRMELILELYGMFVSAYLEEGRIPEYTHVKKCFSAFAYDYLDLFMEQGVITSFTRQNQFATEIVLNRNLNQVDYLYDYGEYISENELQMASFLATCPQESIDRMADTFTEGYRLGFIATGKDITIKKTVAIRYFIGFERVVRKAISNFEKMGLQSILYRAQTSFVMGRRPEKIGYYVTPINKQFEYDHEYDKLLYFNHKYVARKLEAYKAALDLFKEEASVFGGPAVIESFGEPPFSPIAKPECLKPTKEDMKTLVDYTAKAGELLNRYVKGEERSFTIISFPTPQIGKQFKEIFEETIKINTLDYMKYQKIQQTIIDTLDQASTVYVKGCGENKTELTIALWKLQNPEKETIFENCVADVNIPVGEVFTSPVLEGTNGVLHVTEVFLNGLQYKDLQISIKDGMITDYHCANSADESANRKLIRDHILYQHETLPIGEFAIGTNTAAYVMGKKYHIENVMTILIAEKTGPHFAFGDTCYSHEEDILTYNPDGKAIVARQNSVSAKRHTDIANAYMNCHTDITIPYDELGELSAIYPDGTRHTIIRDSRFVLEGTEELNKPFDE